MHTQDNLAAGGWNSRSFPFDDLAAQSAVEPEACHVCLEHPQMQPQAGTSFRKLSNGSSKQPFPYALTTSWRQNVKIVQEASPDGIEVTIATDKCQRSPS